MLCPPIFILKSYNIVFSKVISLCDFNENEVFVVYIFNTVHFIYWNIDRISGKNPDLTPVFGYNSFSLDYIPVLIFVSMALK